jgi:hypothetical protein
LALAPAAFDFHAIGDEARQQAAAAATKRYFFFRRRGAFVLLKL